MVGSGTRRPDVERSPRDRARPLEPPPVSYKEKLINKRATSILHLDIDGTTKVGLQLIRI